MEESDDYVAEMVGEAGKGDVLTDWELSAGIWTHPTCPSGACVGQWSP